MLARQVGCTEAIGFDRSQQDQDDSGAETADALGIEYHGFETAAAPKADLLFHTAGVGHGGDALFKAAEEHLVGRVVFVGFFGDKVWGLDHDDLDGDIPRDDTAGMELSEYRLSVGFITCSVPYWGGRGIRSIRAIAESAEMSPWSVARPYNRPICRRIVEGAGVPRNVFGVKNAGSSIRRPIPSTSSRRRVSAPTTRGGSGRSGRPSSATGRSRRPASATA